MAAGGAGVEPPDKITASVVADPTRAAQRQARWRMTPSERVAAMYRGHLTLFQCLAWAARYPDQVPQLNGEWWFIAIPHVRRRRTQPTPRHD